MVSIIYIASLLYTAGEITIGTIMSFYFYMIMLLFNFNLISMTFGNLMSVLGASDKIIEIMEKECLINTKGGK